MWESEEGKTDLEKIWEKFVTHLAPKVNHRLERSDEAVDDFMSRCPNHASKRRFRDNKEVEERLI